MPGRLRQFLGAQAACTIASQQAMRRITCCDVMPNLYRLIEVNNWMVIG